MKNKKEKEREREREGESEMRKGLKFEYSATICQTFSLAKEKKLLSDSFSNKVPCTKRFTIDQQ